MINQIENKKRQESLEEYVDGATPENIGGKPCIPCDYIDGASKENLASYLHIPQHKMNKTHKEYISDSPYLTGWFLDDD
jgi:hypothetical protein